jgi:hypothetical protein
MNRRAFLVVIAILLGLVTLPVHVSFAVPAEVSKSAVDGSSARIKACRDAATKKGDVKVDILFVIDTSMSLRDSDPFGKTIRDPARVRAMESVVSMLGSDLSENPESSATSSAVKIRLNFLDFGSKVRPSFGASEWQRIEDFDSQSLKSFGVKDDDPDTDYVGAVIDRGGVVDVLAQAARQSDCQIVLWFTDGKFDFDPKTGVGPRSFSWLEAELGEGRGVVRDRTTASAARATGEKLLCNSGRSRPRSVANDLRALDVGGALTVIGVGLNTTAADNFALLRRLLEDKDCGSLDPVGFLVEVKSAEDLAAAMRKAIFGGEPAPPPVCDISTVDTGASFYIAEPVRRADLFLRAREKVSEIQLVRLGGSKAVVITLFKGGVLRPAESTEGIRVTTRQLDEFPTLETTLQFSSPTEQWVGDWVLRACNESGLPAEIDADLVIRGCIAFDLAAGYDRIVVGRSSSLFLMLKRCGEDASRLSTVTALTLSATMLIDGKKVNAVLAENETLLEVPFAPTEASLGGSASKGIKLQVLEVNATYEVLSGSRPVVLEWSRDNSVFDISLVAPPNTPYVELVGCRDIVERTRSAVCEFKATAKDAVGRVSTEGARILPGSVLGDGVVIRASSSTRFPLTVRPGSPETFTFTFDLEGVRKNERVATQAFEVEFSYATDGEPVETGVVSGEFAIEPNLSVSIDRLRALLFALMGLVAALAIFALARYVFATIQVPREGMLWGGCIDVSRCDPETVRAALRTAEVDFDALPISPSRFGVKKVNELGMVGDNGLSLRARAGWRLLSELGYVEAAHSEFPVIGSSGVVASRMRQSRSFAGRTPLNLVGQWWLIPQGSVDVNSESIDDVVARLQSLKGKLVFVASTAEPPQTFFSDLGFTIAGGVSLGLSEVAKRLLGKAPKSEPVNDGTTAAKDESGPKVPEI